MSTNDTSEDRFLGSVEVGLLIEARTGECPHRNRLAELSDAMGMVTRTDERGRNPRYWSPAQVDALADMIKVGQDLGLRIHTLARILSGNGLERMQAVTLRACPEPELVGTTAA